MPDPNPALSQQTRKEALAKETHDLTTKRALQKMEDQLQAERWWIFYRGEADADESEKYYRLGPRISSSRSSTRFSRSSSSKPSSTPEIFLIRAFQGPESSIHRIAIQNAIASASVNHPNMRFESMSAKQVELLHPFQAFG